VGGSTALPAGTAAVLHLRGDSDKTPQVRLDSLIPRGDTPIAPSTQVRIRRESLNGSCLRAHARLTATLTAPLDVDRP
jgi:hypothetical protein